MKTVYEALREAGLTDSDIQAHAFATACTLTVARNTGLPAKVTGPALISVTTEKLGVSPLAAMQFMAVIIESLQEDENFRNRGDEAVRTLVGQAAA